MSELILFEDIVHPGAAWTHILKRGTALTITDIEGSANVGAIMYNNDCPSERLNIPDTLKAQHIAKLTKGNVLYSDMGRVLLSITDDSIGWHDPLGGCLNSQLLDAKYGSARYQEHRNDFHRNSYDSFLIELEKYGLGKRDICPNVNFFSKVLIGLDGNMTYVPNHSPAGSKIELRAEMNVLLILSTCPHPMDPNPVYSPKPVRLTVKKSPPPSITYICRTLRPENERGFNLTERYFL